MSKFFLFITTNFWKITTVIFLFLFLSNGCVNNKISKLDSKFSKNSASVELKFDSINTELNNYATKDDIKKIMNTVMFNYIIYERDLDDKKVTLSEIKNKSELND